MSTLSVCLCTYRRPALLRLLLDDLLTQTRKPEELVVVDNDAEGSARAVVEQWQRESSPAFAVRYEIERRKNIPHARNRSVMCSSGDWLAFPDDDERAAPGWLENLLKTAQEYRADGVIGPVLRVPPQGAPDWLIRSGVLQRLRYQHGEDMRYKAAGFGNVLLRASLVRKGDGPFDPEFGLTGVDDLALLARLDSEGAKIVWCDAPDISEPVEPARMKLDWIFRRAERNGRDYALMKLEGRYGPVSAAGRIGFAARALVQGGIALALAGLAFFVGRHLALRWYCTALANYGKLTAFWGKRVEDYA